MVLHIQLPSGEQVDYPATAARLASAAGNLAVERLASGEVLYASAPEAELTVGNGSETRYFHLQLMNARLTPAEWSFLAADVTELPDAPLEQDAAAETEQIVFPMSSKRPLQ